MRVLQFMDGLGIGGAERVAATISHVLTQHGIPNDVLRRYPIAGLEKSFPEGVNIYDLQATGKFDLKAMRKLADFAKDYDILHIHLRGSFLFYGVASKLFRIPSKKVVFHDHYGDIDIDQSAGLLLRNTMRNIPFIGVSRSLTEWAHKVVGKPMEQISLLENIVIPNPVKELTNSQWEPLTWVMVGNYRPTKNQELALEILKAWNAKHPEQQAHLTLIGQPNDPVYFQQLQQKAKELDIIKHVDFKQDIQNPQEILSGFSLGLHTATSETGPLSLIEMLAQGLPFLGSPTGEVPRQIQPDLPDWIAPDWQVNSWINRIAQLLKTNRREAGQLAQQTFQKYYDSENYFQALMKIYQQRHSMV